MGSFFTNLLEFFLEYLGLLINEERRIHREEEGGQAKEEESERKTKEGGEKKKKMDGWWMVHFIAPSDIVQLMVTGPGESIFLVKRMIYSASRGERIFFFFFFLLFFPPPRFENLWTETRRITRAKLLDPFPRLKLGFRLIDPNPPRKFLVNLKTIIIL